MISKLTFERKFLKRNPKVNSTARTYIDFIIDGVSLTKLLGGVGSNIGKFGWKTNTKFEIEEFNAFRIGKKSSTENGLFSLYVCAECGDEGCGAVMFQIENKAKFVTWSDFVWSDGYVQTDDEPNEKIDLKPLKFNYKEYDIALFKLKKLILEK